MSQKFIKCDFEFCDTMMQKLDKHLNFVNSIVTTDESDTYVKWKC